MQLNSRGGPDMEKLPVLDHFSPTFDHDKPKEDIQIQ
jgi:hypothetical protein